MEEPRKVIKAWYLGSLQVQATMIIRMVIMAMINIMAGIFGMVTIARMIMMAMTP